MASGPLPHFGVCSESSPGSLDYTVEKKYCLLVTRARAASGFPGCFQVVVIRDQPERAHQAVDKLRLSHEYRARPVDDGIVDGPEHKLKGETDVGFFVSGKHASDSLVDAQYK